MASWKKLIVSGSDAVLSTVTVDTCVVGNLCGEAGTAVTATTALKSCIIDTDVTGTRYLTFVSDEGNSQQLNIDKTTLSYAADTNLLAIGSDSSAPGAICFVAGVGGSPGSTMLQTQPLAANTIVCFPDISGVIIVDQGAQTISGNKTFSGANTFTGVTDFTSTVCLGDATSDIIQATGSVSISGSLTVDGTIVGQITNATCVCVGKKSDSTSYYPTFVDSSGSAEILYVDSGNNLTYNPSTNTLQTAVLSGTTCVHSAYICSNGAICAQNLQTSANAVIGGNMTVGGSLIVNGDFTYLCVSNLAVEDRFILLNSGSIGTVNPEGGIVIDAGSGTGPTYFYDAGSSRWGFCKAFNSSVTGSGGDGLEPEAFAAAVVENAACCDTGYKKPGNIFVCTATQDIYIYS